MDEFLTDVIAIGSGFVVSAIDGIVVELSFISDDFESSKGFKIRYAPGKILKSNISNNGYKKLL